MLADVDTPVTVFLKLRSGNHSFLLESVTGGENVARYSFIGSCPRKVIRVGDNEDLRGDPLPHLEAELAERHFVDVPGASVPTFTGGAVGYLSYDCVRFFEPRTAPAIAAQRDALGVPDAVFMLCDDIVVFDHAHQVIKVRPRRPQPPPAAAAPDPAAGGVPRSAPRV